MLETVLQLSGRMRCTGGPVHSSQQEWRAQRPSRHWTTQVVEWSTGLDSIGLSRRAAKYTSVLGSSVGTAQEHGPGPPALGKPYIGIKIKKIKKIRGRRAGAYLAVRPAASSP